MLKYRHTSSPTTCSCCRLVVILTVLLAALLYLLAVSTMADYALPYLNLGPSVLSTRSIMGWLSSQSTDQEPPNQRTTINEVETRVKGAEAGFISEQITEVQHQTLKDRVKLYLSGQAQTNHLKVNNDSIPHIIHQSWKSFIIPVKVVPWVKSWIHNHPTWDYWFWTPETVVILLRKHYPHLVDLYKNLPFHVQRADAMRYIVLYHFGGVYADLDVECLKPVDFWADNFTCVLPEEPHIHNLLYVDAHKNTINALLMSKKKHPFFKELLLNLEDSSQSPLITKFNDIIRTTGPFFVQTVLEKFFSSAGSSEVTITDPEYFIPCFDETQRGHLQYLCYNETACTNENHEYVHSVCEEMLSRNFINEPSELSFTDHHWLHTWFDEDGWKNKSTESVFQIVPNVKIFKG